MNEVSESTDLASRAPQTYLLMVSKGLLVFIGFKATWVYVRRPISINKYLKHEDPLHTHEVKLPSIPAFPPFDLIAIQ